jgi:hypothetical protein
VPSLVGDRLDTPGTRPILYRIGPFVAGPFMIWLGLLSGIALVIALAAVSIARRTRRRLDQLQQSYWDLRYEHSRLKAQVKRLDPEEAPEPEPAAAPPSTTFIPLSSLKR